MKNDYSFDIGNLSLVKFEMNIKTAEIIEIMLSKLTDEEMKLVTFLTKNAPFRSSMEDDEKYWDIIFLDDNVKNSLCKILKKYKVEFLCSDITNLYYEKSKIIGKTFIEEIDDFLDYNLNIDFILDKINEVGMGKLKKYELDFLKKQSKK